MSRKIIIDADPGIDDAFAIVMAHYEKSLEVLAIHTVAGNVNLENTTRNAQGLVKLLDMDVRVASGADSPLVYEPLFASEVHGHNGFGGVELNEFQELSEMNAVESAVDILTNSDEKVTIVALGPLTNVALLLKSYPHLKEKIECISLMGGGTKGGNTTNAGEFNFYVDPHAAHIVFNSGIPIIMAGLNVTETAGITLKDVEELKENGGKIGKFLHDISQVSFNFSKEVLGGEQAAKINLHDVMSVLYLTKPDLFETEDYFVDIGYEEGIMRGMSLADVRPRATREPNTKVITEIDAVAFREYLISRIIEGEK